ncbi:alpha/beta fold hydrolase [Nocardia sp. CA-107356]|uniref:alpha/beta fold hydrolase n=1 Tax=Nocardia sp. CA-107356 TaxID=3239972 RepID=UPI003D921710
MTCAHAEKVAATTEFTMCEEYLTHAFAEIEMLCAATTVDAGPVFVVGHGMGGTVAPRVAAATLAGMVLLAADRQPMQWAAVGVLRHLAEIDPASVAAFPSIETIIEQAKLPVHPCQRISDGCNTWTPKSSRISPIGWSRSCWGRTDEPEHKVRLRRSDPLGSVT